MYRLTLLFLLLTASLPVEAQKARDILIGIQADLAKTDQTRLLNKAQFGGEFNYYASSNITATTGFEIWTADEFSFLMGVRFYPNDYTFIRLRGLIGANDISLGGGWTKPLGQNFRFEAIADMYFKLDFAIRAGVVYVIRK